MGEGSAAACAYLLPSRSWGNAASSWSRPDLGLLCHPLRDVTVALLGPREEVTWWRHGRLCYRGPGWLSEVSTPNQVTDLPEVGWAPAAFRNSLLVWPDSVSEASPAIDRKTQTGSETASVSFRVILVAVLSTSASKAVVHRSGNWRGPFVQGGHRMS